MAQLSPGPRLLAVQVGVRSRNREETLARRERADEVDHHRVTPRSGRPERKPEDRAEVVLELARLGAVDRPVPGVMDTRGKLVREQLAADVEELDREHSDVVE